ncbi:MAG TPA: DNA primase [Acidimicrobiia bacterium]|nr:DNA primase [Acidimicrobiia bacterium]
MAFMREDIERVRSSTSIVDLVDSVTTVRKRGRAVKAICPFHQEKTPSMSIDVARGLYHCFGCGVGGDVFKFVQETQALDFSEAVEFLAARAGITLRIDHKAAQRRGERQALIEAVDKAVDFYRDRLKNSPDAASARRYLRSRGYDTDVVDRFGLGYSPAEGWDQAVQYLKGKGVTEKAMLDSGLAARNQRGRLRDWFRGRIMFPIYDIGGSPVGFGARLLEGEGPKYLNSPETRIYRKAQLLYGLNWAKAPITRSGYSLVVEGYTDVIGLHLADLPVAVATCGTALGEDHFDLLRRFSDRIVLAFDADEAGVGAALRGDELSTPADLDLDVRVALMPEGADPADLVQSDRLDELRKAVDSSRPLLEFRIDREVERHNVEEAEGRARAVRAAARLIARQSDEIVRSEYSRRVSRATGVDLAAVQRAVQQAFRETDGRSESRAAIRQPPAVRPRSALSGPELAERELLRLMLANDGRLPAEELDVDLFTLSEHRAYFEALHPLMTSTPPGKVIDLNALPDGFAEQLSAVVLDDLPLDNDPAALVRRLERWRTERRIGVIRHQVESEAPGSEAHSNLLRQLIALERRKRELDSE